MHMYIVFKNDHALLAFTCVMCYSIVLVVHNQLVTLRGNSCQSSVQPLKVIGHLKLCLNSLPAWGGRLEDCHDV